MNQQKEIEQLKAENKELKSARENARIISLEMHNGKIDMTLGSEYTNFLADMVYQTFIQNGAKNFLATTIEVKHNTEKYELTIQKVNGLTYEEKLNKLTKERDEWKHRAEVAEISLKKIGGIK